MTPENLAKLDEHFRAELSIEPPEGYILQEMSFSQTDEYSLPYLTLGWGGRQGDELRGSSWWVTSNLERGLNALLAIL